MNARVSLAIGVALLVAAHLIAVHWIAPRRAEVVTTAEIHDALTPGEFAGTLMLGGFRGLATDLLWMRAVAAKDAGRFYESLALCEAIARVQPRFEQVWEFMSWDLAYNIAHEIDDDDGKWAWFQAGLGFNARGCRRNPDSVRLLRHLAWMFHHKGDWFHRRIEAHDFTPLIDPILAEVDRRSTAHGEPGRVATLPAGAGLTTYELSTALYRAAIVLAEAEGVAVQPFMRRMVPLGIERDGNLWRNRGDHRRALTRWLDALESWREVVAWHDRPAHGDHEGHDEHDEDDEDDARDRAISRDSYERNEGRLRRKAAFLARRLAEDPALGERVATAIEARDWATARAALGSGGWRMAANRGGVRWLDEPSR